jgi:hypothetical protein
MGAGLSEGASLDLIKVMRQYRGHLKQQRALDFLHYITFELGGATIWSFARQYRNNDDGTDIDFCAVAEWYEAQPHQIAALRYLQGACEPQAMDLFYRLWNTATPLVVDIPKDRGVSEDDYKRLYDQMIHRGDRVPGRGSAEEANVRRMVLELQKLEKHLGVKVTLTSGFRPEPINSQVGGVPGSMHVHGLAADIYSEDMEDMEFEGKVAKYWLDRKLGGVGYGMAARRFTHVDNGEVREWDY